MELYLFNPDSDLALANNETNYIAPASARRMAQDLALCRYGMQSRIMQCWLLPPIMRDFLKQMRELFPLQGATGHRA